LILELHNNVKALFLPASIDTKTWQHTN
jgi:hypothetical protein